MKMEIEKIDKLRIKDSPQKNSTSENKAEKTTANKQIRHNWHLKTISARKLSFFN